VEKSGVVNERRDRHGGCHVRMSRASWIAPCHSGVAGYDAHAVQGSGSLGDTVVAGGESLLSGIPGEALGNIFGARANEKARISNARNHCCEDGDEGYVPVNGHALSMVQGAA
jgi:hypothetical protein